MVHRVLIPTSLASFALGLVGLVFSFGFVALVAVMGTSEQMKFSYHQPPPITDGNGNTFLDEYWIWYNFPILKDQSRLPQWKPYKAPEPPVIHLRHW